MDQLSLGFVSQSAPRTLVDDATGRIVYASGAVDRAAADAWFAQLRDATEWHSERRPMYDRVVDVPRLTAHFWADVAWPQPLLDARRVAEAFAGEPFNSVGLNLYRDGRDSVAMHNDHTSDLVENSSVVLISLGSVRRMRVHSKERPRRTFDVELEPGSIFLMAGAAQHHWEHGIPKTADAVGPRISLAFRRRSGTKEG